MRRREARAAESGRPRRARSVWRWILRLTCTAHALLLTAQPILIGQYLTGRFVMIRAHVWVSLGLELLALVLAAAAIGYAVTGGHRAVLVVGLTLAVLTEVQAVAGHAGLIGLHLPLGVSVVSVGVALVIWVWTPMARSSRGGRPRAGRLA